MFTHLKNELAADWHKLVTGTARDIDRLLEWISINHERKLLMTIADDIATIKAAVSTPATVTVDLSTVAKADALAAVASDVTVIKGELTLTPPAPPAA